MKGREGVKTEQDEVSLTGTSGGRILPFPGPSQSGFTPGFGPVLLQEQKESYSMSKPGSTIPTTVDLLGLSSVKQGLSWRPVKFVRNPAYPKVVAEGCHFKRDSAGFALRRKDPFKHLGYYRQEVINKLEREYGSKKTRKRQN